MYILVLIDLIKMWVWHVLRVGSDVQGYQFIDILDLNVIMVLLKLDSDVPGYHWYCG